MHSDPPLHSDSHCMYTILSFQGNKSHRFKCNIVVRTNDTDVLVIILSNMDKLNASSQIWLEGGVSSLNTLRYRCK